VKDAAALAGVGLENGFSDRAALDERSRATAT
jgi:hypothetical protein